MRTTFENFITEVGVWCPACLLPSAETFTCVELVDGIPRAATGPITTCEECGRVVGPDGVEVE